MKLLIVSDTFPDSDAQALRESRHKVNCVRDVAAAQRALKDGYQPQAAYIDNSLTGAQYFAKQVKSMFPDARVFMVAEEEITLDSPGQWGIEGFVRAPLTVDEVLLRTPPKPGRQVPAGERGNIELASPEVPDEDGAEVRPPSLVEKARKTFIWANNIAEGLKPGRKEKCLEPEEGRSDSPDGGRDDTVKKGMFHATLFRLSFPAIIGAFVLTFMLGLLSHNPSPPKEELLPNFYGISAEQAAQLLDELHVTYELIEVPSCEEAGMVVSQDPPAGTQLKDAGTFTLLVSNNETTATSDIASETPPTPQEPAPAPPGNEGSTASAAPSQPAPTPPANARPVASFVASQTSGPSSGFIVSFDASSSYDPDGGRIVSYAWSFGGGGVRASHEFVSATAPTTFTVTLTVTDDEGATASKSVRISAI